MVAPDLEEKLGRALAGVRSDVVAAYLFGSHARGTAREDSDVDVAVLVQGEPASTLDGLGMDLQADLERDLRRRVDLVVLNRAPRTWFIACCVMGACCWSGIGRRASPSRSGRATSTSTCSRSSDAIAARARERRFAEHTLQIAIQAAMDVASHIVSDEKLGEPATNSQLFELLAQAGWLQIEHSERLRKMAGFRNVLVHGYAIVDPAIVRDVVENQLGDLLDFVAAVRSRLSEPRDPS